MYLLSASRYFNRVNAKYCFSSTSLSGGHDSLACNISGVCVLSQHQLFFCGRKMFIYIISWTYLFYHLITRVIKPKNSIDLFTNSNLVVFLICKFLIFIENYLLIHILISLLANSQIRPSCFFSSSNYVTKLELAKQKAVKHYHLPKSSKLVLLQTLDLIK